MTTNPLYQELIDSFNETFQDYKKRNMSNLEALSKTYEDFELIMNQGDLQKAIILIEYCEKVMQQPYIFYKSKDYLINYLKEINYDLVKKELSSMQYDELIKKRDKAISELNNKPLTNSARARWYYSELTTEVINYYKTIFQSDITAEQLIKKTLDRFKRDCKNTKSEKFVVYITLAEQLLSSGLINSIDFESLKTVLKEYNVEELGEQLTNNEKEELQARIDKVLKVL
ncbi:Imm3 family immunity protein [Paenibacillus shenyangensis]|uniref:Imm3 family immunity protein n=1 Tax=Paenibacillus sp. A9 TaxID=1284352 RepID=UPI000377DB79|nr:Imm3 family immunity protein [Paenibacillus sp. A9]